VPARFYTLNIHDPFKDVIPENAREEMIPLARFIKLAATLMVGEKSETVESLRKFSKKTPAYSNIEVVDGKLNVYLGGWR
jgi:hypothetical protein